MTMAADKQDKVLNFSSEREQSGACSSSAERENNQGKNFLNVPNLRFPEFNGEWVKYRVSDVLDFYSTNSLSWDQLEYNTDELQNLHYGLIHVGLPTAVDMNESILPNIKKEFLPKNYELCKNGDVAFADASEDTNEVAKAIEFVNLPNRNVVCGLHTIHGRDNHNLTSVGFKGYAFASESFHNQIRRIAQGTKIFSISCKNFTECYIGIPSKEEQTKIAKLLGLIDERISTQIRIIEELKMFRDTLMFKLLSPRKNWEHVCIHDIAMVVGGGTPDTNVKEYWDGNIQWFTPSEIGKEKYAIVSERTISQAGLDNSSAKLLPANTILLSTRATIGECSIAKKECCTNQGFQSLIATKVTPEFLYYLIQTKKRDLLSKASGSTFSEISANEVRKIHICIPTTAKEQEALVQPLSAYDEKIETECKILYLYKLQKQFLLSKLFI